MVFICQFSEVIGIVDYLEIAAGKLTFFLLCSTLGTLVDDFVCYELFAAVDTHISELHSILLS